MPDIFWYNSCGVPFPELTLNLQCCIIYIMTRTQIQLPDVLYAQAKKLAELREISLAELVRNGLEYMLNVSAPADAMNQEWKMPTPKKLGTLDPFKDEAWRMNLYCGDLREETPSYSTKRRKRASR
jgi:hypothetical protein